MTNVSVRGRGEIHGEKAIEDGGEIGVRQP